MTLQLTNARNDHGQTTRSPLGGGKPTRVFFHYSKPASLAAGTPKLTVHFKGVCHIVDHIMCLAPVESHHQSHQPRCIMRGKTREVNIVTNAKQQRVAVIHP